jgi:methylenetetrahydrofolate reductase (NADPH)
MKWLKVKCDAGADFIITQLFYDMESFEKWVKECRAAGISVPIIPGVMPIQNFASFRRLVKLTGCPVPDSIMRDLEPIKVNRKYPRGMTLILVRRCGSKALWCRACNDHGLAPDLIRFGTGSTLLHAQPGEIGPHNSREYRLG